MNDQHRQKLSRLDLRTAHSVDEGLRLQQSVGGREAAKFMRAQRVPFNVIVRALMEPGRRRAAHLANTSATPAPLNNDRKP